MRSISKSCLALAFAAAALLRAQSTDFTVEGRPVQVHGFASQAFLASDNNNYLTMPTTRGGFAFTDFGGNISIQFNLPGRSEGADLRWNTPLHGLLAGASLTNSASSVKGIDSLGLTFMGRTRKYELPSSMSSTCLVV